MARSSTNMLRALKSDERGTGIVELALIAPVLALLTVGIIDLSKGITRRAELHQAVHRTLEKAAAKNFAAPASSGKPDYSYLKSETAKTAGVTEDDVTVEVWLECDGEEQAEYGTTCPPLTDPPAECADPNPPADVKCTPITARYLQVRVDSSFSPSFGAVVSPEADGTFPLWAEAAVRIQ